MYLHAPPSNDYQALLLQVQRIAARHKQLSGYNELGKFKFKKVFKAPVKLLKKEIQVTKKIVKKTVKVVKKIAPYVAVAAAIYFGGPYVLTALKAGGAKAAGMISMFTQKRTDEGASPDVIASEIAQMQQAQQPQQIQPTQYMQQREQPQQYMHQQATQPPQQYMQTQEQQEQRVNSSMPAWLLPALAIGATVLLRN